MTMSPKQKARACIGGAILCFLMVAVGALMVWQTYVNNADTTEQPVTYSAAELSQRGVDGNRHVRISDGVLAGARAIQTYTSYNRTSRTWTTTHYAYVPIASRSGEALPLLLIGKKKVLNPGESMATGSELQGMVHTAKGLLRSRDSQDTLPAEVRQDLRRLYPTIDFSRSMVVSLDETPSFDRNIQLIFGAIGLACAIVAFVLIYYARRNWKTAAAQPQEQQQNPQPRMTWSLLRGFERGDEGRSS